MSTACFAGFATEANNPLTENRSATSVARASRSKIANTADPLPVMDAKQGRSEINSSQSFATDGYAGNTTASSAFRYGNVAFGNLAKTALTALRLSRGP